MDNARRAKLGIVAGVALAASAVLGVGSGACTNESIGAAATSGATASGATASGATASSATGSTGATGSSSPGATVTVSSSVGSGGSGGSSNTGGAGGAGGSAPACVGAAGTFYAQSAYIYGNPGPTPMCDYATDVILVVNTADA